MASGREASEGAVASPEEGTGLSLEHRFEILRNARRRYALEYLRERGGPVVIGDLAEHVAARETGTARDQLTRQERKRAYVGLYQCHLPTMDEASVVELDTTRGIVSPGPAAPGLYPYLSAGDPQLDEWYRYYLAIVALGTVVTAVGLVVGVAGPAVLATVATLVACALAHVVVEAGVAPSAERRLLPLPRWPDV
ncbi:DUF7344 domain-containing protein [Halorarius halobius]|uniref:DUF7344 domain-containing protein n=1 Tax=Halorarius halobius TaxID=2962671 RepID=UPI0020CD08DA|nr:hypothetical protein [Halorarius halobius]